MYKNVKYCLNPRCMRERELQQLGLSVCLSGENKLLRSLTPVICSAYSIYMTNARFSLKMHGLKVVTINTFHGDPRPSLWR